MGLFEEIAGKLGHGGPGGTGGPDLMKVVVELLGQQQGGLAGLASAFQQKGLGEVVSSWIGTGQNLPVSASQIREVFGDEQVRTVAQKSGITADAATSTLADLLPGVVDKLTPGGRVPEGGDLMSGLGAVLNLFSGGKAGR